MNTPLTEQTILVTGAADGIGKGTARELARRGTRVLLHGRNAERAAAARDEIAAATGNDRLETYVADFASLRDVQSLAAGFHPARLSPRPHQQRRHRRRAAWRTAASAPTAMSSACRSTISAPYCWRISCCRCCARAPARIVNVASVGQAPLDFTDLMLERGYDGFRAYCRSKLAMVMATFELAGWLDPSEVTVNALHPARCSIRRWSAKGSVHPRVPSTSASRPSGDATDLMDLVRDDLGLCKTGGRFPKKATCLAIYSYAVNAQIPVRETLDRAFPWCVQWEEPLKRLFARYVETKQAQAVLDYDDLLLYWSQMMQIGEIARVVSGRFDHILVDEYQDTNALQASILLGLKPDGAGVTVVGDDAQSIYSFRSATVRNILDFPSRFDPPAEVVRLEQNYRSTRPILDACNRIIAHAGESFTKTLFTTRTDGRRPLLAMVADEIAQVEFLIDRILANREAGMELRDQAVLFRTSHHASQLEVELVRRNIPFVKFGGLKFLEASHVKDVVAMLRWAENPRDHVAGLRVLKLIRGVGPKTARRVLVALERDGHSLSALDRFPPPSAAARAWPDFVGVMTELAAARRWQGQLERLRVWYDLLLDLLYDDPRPRRADLDQLEGMAAQHPNRSSFLTDLTLDPPQASGGEAGVPLKDEDWLVLSTIHSAKGQEWPAVFVFGDGNGRRDR